MNARISHLRVKKLWANACGLSCLSSPWYMPYHLAQAKAIQIFWMGSLAVAKRNLLWKLPIWLSKNLQKRKRDFSLAMSTTSGSSINATNACTIILVQSCEWRKIIWLSWGEVAWYLAANDFHLKDSLLLKRLFTGFYRPPIRIHVNVQRLQNFTCSCDVKSATLFQLLKDTAVESLRFSRDDKIPTGALKLGVQKLKMNNKSMKEMAYIH